MAPAPQNVKNPGALPETDLSLPPVLIVAGPTCSGKSALALALAKALNGGIVNADSMQIYKGLEILTAQPTPDVRQKVGHWLYGVLTPSQKGSAALWREMALAAIGEIRAQGKLPILCGGTGLYFKALQEGLSPIPSISPAIKRETQEFMEKNGPQALHEKLAGIDAKTAARLSPADSQRIARAWEVWAQTGRSLSRWHEVPAPAPLKARYASVLIDPDRGLLERRLKERFRAMLAEGALEEVRALLAANLLPSLPAMRAHGVPELIGYLRGELTLEAAVEKILRNIRAYTKRQNTWYRHQALAPLSRSVVLGARVCSGPEEDSAPGVEVSAETAKERLLPLLRHFLLSEG